MITSYKELQVWQKARKLAIETYKVTEKFPKSELYGLSSQLQRSAVSIASNIAEGRHRGTKKDFINFLRIANGSLAEYETQISIAKELPSLRKFDYSSLENLSIEVSKMLNVMIKKLEA